MLNDLHGFQNVVILYLYCMKAIVYTRYGPPEVAQLKEMARPVPKDNEILIKVTATTVNRTDCGFRSASYFVSRFWSGLFRPKIPVLGCEFSGIIEVAGSGVTDFKVGDKVFGYDDSRFGGHSEYKVMAASDAVCHVPDNLDLYQAAALTEGAHYALCDIRAAKVEAGQDVLVYGASGAIGSAAVQLLKHFGARVTAVCNSKNVLLVKSLGADTVIDYQTEDFTKTSARFHFIFDAVGKTSFKVCKKLLTEKGQYVSTELGKNGENIFLALFTPLAGGKKVLFPVPSIQQEDLMFFKQLVEKGEFRPVIDRYYLLDELVEAYRYVETGQKTGNVIIKVV